MQSFLISVSTRPALLHAQVMAAQELSEPTIEEDGTDIIDNIREQPERSEGQERKPPTSWFNRLSHGSGSARELKI